MGEVRAQAVLINAVDEGLVRRGMPRPEGIRRYKADALVDTGSVCTVIPLHIANQLGLETLDRRGVTYADGRQETVEVAKPIMISIAGRRTADEACILGDEVLIGQTVLEKLDLHVDCTRQRLIPNPAHPDQPVIKIK